MIKFYSALMILVGMLLIYAQWGTVENGMRTAQLLVDLVTAHGQRIGRLHGFMYVYTPVAGIAMGLLGIIDDYLPNPLRHRQK